VSTATSSNPVAAVALDYTAMRPVDEDEKPLFWGLTASAWVKIAIITALLVALFRFNLARLWLKTNPFTGDANWGHTPIIPIIGLYFLYLNRDQLLAAKVKPILFEPLTRARLVAASAAITAGAISYLAGGTMLSWVLGQSDTAAALGQALGAGLAVWGVLMLGLGWGLGNLLFGLLTFAFGIYPGQNDWLKDYGMVHTIFGTVLTLCGWEVMRVAWFPIAFLICGIPWPGLVYSWLASPLQHLAAAVAVKTLNLTGVDSVRSGTRMFILGGNGQMRPLNVAEACAGLRSLMTFISVAAAVAFLSNRAFWQKVIITASAVPIAIFCNVMRVTGQAYLDRFAGSQWSEGFAHGFVGLVMLIPAFFLILLVGWILDQLFIEEVDDKAKLRAAAKQKKLVVAPAAAEKKIVIAPKSMTGTAVNAKPQGAGAAPLPLNYVPAKAAPAKAVPAAPAPAVKLPPRRNLTGKPDRSVEGNK
jgi:exosortase